MKIVPSSFPVFTKKILFQCCVKLITQIIHLLIIQRVSAKTFEPNISVICQRIFMKFKMQIF
jgi:hypothetical protein